VITQSDLQGRLTELCEQYGVPGAAFAVARGDETAVAWTGTANLRTGLPVVRDTLFAAGSVTKVFTVTLVMALVDEGLVDLDAPVMSYVPELASYRDERAEDITVRMLLNHTSGLPGNVTFDIPRGPDCVARFVEAVGGYALNAPPGKYWSYTNGGLVVAGRVAEVVTGLPFNDALADRLLRPLSLNATSEPHEMVLRSTAVGHVPGEDGALTVVPRFQLGTNAPSGSALACDIDALVAFARMHLREGQGVLSPASVKAMQDKTVELPWGIGYESCGLGWMRRETAAGPLLAHTGASAGQHSSLIVLPDQQGVVAALTNSIGGPAVYGTLSAQLLEEQFGVEPAVPQVPGGTPPQVDLAPLAGVYEADDGRVVLGIEGDRLTVTHEAGGEFTEVMRLIVGAGSFPPAPASVAPVRPDLFVGDGAAPVQFVEPDEAGRPRYVYVGRIYRRAG
jgi:CubicO group peptidase (beta-lactamase class C family)